MSQKIKFTNRGHILASVGAAIGIANLVLFPARVFSYGGLAFILAFVLCTFFLGVPIMIGETALGKNSQRDAVNAYRGIGGNRWAYAGFLGLLTSCFILSFYIVVAGWALYYLYLYIFAYPTITTAIAEALSNEQPSIAGVGGLFGQFVTSENLVFTFSGLFMAITIFIVANNIQRGIEWVSKRFVPLLIVLIVFLIFTIPFIKGNELNYDNFSFDFNALFSIDSSGRIGIIEAVGQAFFSLSLGASGMITYGTHVKKDTNVVMNSHYIVHTDTLVALLAALLILPLFSPSSQISAAPPLVFISLVDVFNNFGIFWGRLIGISFFTLFNLAILTSSISLLEPTVNYFSQNKKNGRRNFAILIGTFVFIMSIPVVLSIDSNNSSIFTNFLGYGEINNGKTSMGYFNFILDFFGTFCLLAGTFLLAVFIRYKWTIESFFEELKVSHYTPSHLLKKFLTLTILWIIPISMVLLFVGECIKVMYKLGLMG